MLLSSVGATVYAGDEDRPSMQVSFKKPIIMLLADEDRPW